MLLKGEKRPDSLFLLYSTYGNKLFSWDTIQQGINILLFFAGTSDLIKRFTDKELYSARQIQNNANREHGMIHRKYT